MRFDVLTLFPDFFTSPLEQSVIGKAAAKGLIEVRTHNIRDYARDKHRTTDDTPYGGGRGMVMKADCIVRALESILPEKGPSDTVLLATPQGILYDQRVARELSGKKRVVIVCGRYEGVDERVRNFVDMEVSVGDYILTGGEIPALVVIDSVSRLLPGVLGSELSPGEESFEDFLLEYPHYTRPEEFRGQRVPEVLLSGHHEEIRRWRRRESLRRTLERRPDLLEKASLTEEEKTFIEELKKRT